MSLLKELVVVVVEGVGVCFYCGGDCWCSGGSGGKGSQEVL